MNKKNTYVCRRPFIYEYLTKKGFIPYKTAIDYYNCKNIVWLYDDSKELREAVEECYSTK